MSDQLILGIITASCGLIASVFASFVAFKMAELTKIAKATHESVNSLSVILARKLAVATEKLAVADSTPENVENAQDAAKALKEKEQVQDGLATPQK